MTVLLRAEGPSVVSGAKAWEAALPNHHFLQLSRPNASGIFWPICFTVKYSVCSKWIRRRVCCSNPLPVGGDSRLHAKAGKDALSELKSNTYCRISNLEMLRLLFSTVPFFVWQRKSTFLLCGRRIVGTMLQGRTPMQTTDKWFKTDVKFPLCRKL